MASNLSILVVNVKFLRVKTIPEIQDKMNYLVHHDAYCSNDYHDSELLIFEKIRSTDPF